MVDEQILHDCVAQLRCLPPIKGAELVAARRAKGERGRPGCEPDAVLAVKTDMGRMRLAVYTKSVVRRPLPDHLSILEQSVKRRAGEPILLMTRYATPSVADSLKERQINFVDTRGNAFINVPGLICVDIQNRERSLAGETRCKALFRPKSLQLLYVLLTEDGALNETIRALAVKAGVSFGRTASAMKELKDRAFIREGAGEGLEFADKKTLLENWLVNYGEQLRPKLVLGRYKMAPSVQERTAEILAGSLPTGAQSYAVGGSLGAYLLTKYYRGPTTEIFVRPDSVVKVRESLKLIPAQDTDTTLFNLFCPSVVFPTKLTSFAIAHPLLIYAELLHCGGSRDREAAKVVYDTFLKRQFDEHRTGS